MQGMSGIVLVMMVRDEAETIRATLASAAPYVDRMLVFDTGSTDDTAEVAAAAGAEVLHINWRGRFDESRNAVLNVAAGACAPDDYLLLLDGGETLLTPFTPGHAPGYLFELTYGDGWIWRQPRMILPRVNYRYRGAMHELLEGPTPVPSTGRILSTTGKSERSAARYASDRRALANRRDPRGVFYHALSCLWSGDLAAARAGFTKRLGMSSGWEQERYESLMRLGSMGELARHGDALIVFRRAEPALFRARYCNARGYWGAAKNYAQVGMHLERPADFLFLYEPAYETACHEEYIHACYQLEEYAEALPVALDVCRVNPSERATRNLEEIRKAMT
jgi:glycosyltransferase involved in cell wall biosynthesis